MTDSRQPLTVMQGTPEHDALLARLWSRNGTRVQPAPSPEFRVALQLVVRAKRRHRMVRGVRRIGDRRVA